MAGRFRRFWMDTERTPTTLAVRASVTCFRSFQSAFGAAFRYSLRSLLLRLAVSLLPPVPVTQGPTMHGRVGEGLASVVAQIFGSFAFARKAFERMKGLVKR